MTFKEKWDQAGLDLTGAVTTRHKHPELTDEQIIKFLKSTKPTFTGKCLERNSIRCKFRKDRLRCYSIRRKCLDLGVSYNDTLDFKNTQPDLTDSKMLEYMVGVEL